VEARRGVIGGVEDHIKAIEQAKEVIGI